MRRIICAILVCCVTIAASAQTKPATLDGEIAAIKARHEPIDPVDFRQPPVPDEQNAVHFILEAEHDIKLTDQQYQRVWWGDFPSHLPLTNDDLQFMDGVISANRPVFEQLEKSMAMPKMSWTRTYRQGEMLKLSMDEFEMDRWQSLLGLTLAAARFSHTNGDDLSVIQHLLEFRWLCRAGEAYGDFNPEVIAVGKSFLLMPVVGAMQNELKLTGSVREEITLLIGDLLDDRTGQEAMVRMWLNQRMLILDEARPILARPDAQAAWQTDAANCLEFLSGIVRVAQEQSNLPFARTNFPVLQGGHPGGSSTDRPISSLLSSDLSVFKGYFLCRAMDHLVAASLAIQMFKVDHEGKLPESLEEMVPIYLPRVPEDPMDKSNQPLRYLAAREIIYSVGENGTDDGGSSNIRAELASAQARHPEAPVAKVDQQDFIFELNPNLWVKDLNRRPTDTATTQP